MTRGTQRARPVGCRRCKTEKAQALKMEAGKAEEENKERGSYYRKDSLEGILGTSK